MTSLLIAPDNSMRNETSSAHLTSDQLASFLDGRLGGADRDRAVNHFAECAECRSELTELRAILESSRSARRRTAWVAGSAALAAALAFAIVPRLVREDSRVPVTDAVRAIDAPLSIGVGAPADGDSVLRSDLKLVWRAIAAHAQYGVVVQDASGARIWEATLTDTSAVPDALLKPGSRYFWRVDARLADGRSAKTDTHEFTIR